MTSKIVLDQDSMQLMAHFAKETNTNVRDCIADETQVVFIVGTGEVGKAVGAKGAHIKKMEALLKKRVKVVEYDAEATKFVTNLCAPAKIASVVVEGDTATITPVDFQNRGLIIGKNANILRKYEMITKRYFPIEHLRVATVEEKI